MLGSLLDSLKSGLSNSFEGLGQTLVNATGASINNLFLDKAPVLAQNRGFDIAQFASEAIHQTDVQSPALFFVEIMPSIAVRTALAMASSSRYTLTADKLAFFCMATSLPSIFVTTDSETKRYGFGPIHKTAIGAGFIDQQFIFIGDGLGIVHSFFRYWIEMSMVKINSSRGFNQSSLESMPYLNRFPEEYYTDIHITTFGKNGAANKKVVMQKAFPIALAEVNLNWAEKDQFMHIPVMFTFMDWYEMPGLNNGVNGLNDVPLFIKDALINVGSQFAYDASGIGRDIITRNLSDIGGLVDNSINTAIGRIDFF